MKFTKYQFNEEKEKRYQDKSIAGLAMTTRKSTRPPLHWKGQWL